ncbi:MAG: hypothetical protein IT317_23540 [Anaerolineales bacterium]|nr:hypothetical protein [Anaerolineales bacterium]
MSDPLASYAALTAPVAPGPAIAYFVTAHGFGHATRACAVMAALRARRPGLALHVFTQAPEWLFTESVPGGVSYHAATTDVGVVQHDALREDLLATLARLDDLLPFDPRLVREWATWLARLRVALVVCDIAPLGLAVAAEAGLPAVLIENFTWDWIYAPYVAAEPGFARHLPLLREAFALAPHHLQAAPVCAPDLSLPQLPPIARVPRHSRVETRAALGLAEHERLVLVTLGGMAGDLPLPRPVAAPPGVVYVLPGAADQLERRGQRLALPNRGDYYHPDLICAADAVVGKLGYSTVAEAYHAGVPFGYVPRGGFHESPVMAEFVSANLPRLEVPPDVFTAGAWGEHVAALLAHTPRPPGGPNGADVAAEYLVNLLG